MRAAGNVVLTCRSILLRLAVFAGLWWGLSGGAPASWSIGLPAVLLALWASWSLLPPVGFSPLRLALFVPRFFARSLWAAVEVAALALAPRLRLAPRLYHYPVSLGSDTSRVFFFNVISLLPGTLSVEIDEQRGLLSVHALRGEQDPGPALAALEREVAALFLEPGAG